MSLWRNGCRIFDTHFNPCQNENNKASILFIKFQVYFSLQQKPFPVGVSPGVSLEGVYVDWGAKRSTGNWRLLKRSHTSSDSPALPVHTSGIQIPWLWTQIFERRRSLITAKRPIVIFTPIGDEKSCERTLPKTFPLPHEQLSPCTPATFEQPLLFEQK